MNQKYLDYLGEDTAGIRHNIINTHNRISQHLDTIQEEQNIIPTNSIKDINLTIEKFMYILLSKSFISNTDKNSISKHYSKFKQIYPEHRNLPANVKNIIDYGKTFIWFGEYGSLLHELIHRSVICTYNSASEISRICSIAILDDYINIIQDSDNDEALFNIPRSYIIKTFGDTYKEIVFLEEFIPDLVNWVITSNKTTNSSIEALREIGQYVLRQGDYSFSSFDIVHNRFSDNQINIFNKLKLSVGLVDVNNIPINTEEHLLAQRLKDNISFDKKNLRDIEFKLTGDFQPGGLNKLLSIVALELLNRAYILSHESNTKFSLLRKEDLNNITGWLGSSSLIERSIQDKNDYLELLSRLELLVKLAGNTLKKSSLYELNLLGSRLQRVAGLDDYKTLRSKTVI
jgi:hypothetical protein